MVNNIPKIFSWIENEVLTVTDADLKYNPTIEYSLSNAVWKVMFLRRVKDGHTHGGAGDIKYLTFGQLKKSIDSLVKICEERNYRLSIDLPPIDRIALADGVKKMIDKRQTALYNATLGKSMELAIQKSYDFFNDWLIKFPSELSGPDECHKEYKTHIRLRKYQMLDVDLTDESGQELAISTACKVFNKNKSDFLILNTPSGGLHLVFLNDDEKAINALRKDANYANERYTVDGVELFTVKPNAETILYYNKLSD